MKLLLAFIFASFGTAFLASDTLGGVEKDSIAVSDLDSNCNGEASKRVIPTRL